MTQTAKQSDQHQVLQDQTDNAASETAATNSQAQATGETKTKPSLRERLAKTAESADAGAELRIGDGHGSGSRGKFKPNTDLDRAVESFLPLSGNSVLRARRTGSDKSQGLSIDGSQITALFGEKVFDAGDKVQAGILLKNGKVITGYILKKENKRGIYIPVYVFPKDMPLPDQKQGQVLEMPVAELVIG